MQLNESTYETIFLLYIDNELSPKERLEVEAFIADNPSYALEMEALQATVLSSDKIQYPFKENLKLQDWEEDLKATYAPMLKADVEAIPGLSTSFKNSLKKETASEAIIVKSFGFNQQKFTYAAVAACLMIFFGYQQLTKTPVSDFSAANANVVSNSNQPANIVEPVATKKQTETKNLQASKSSKKSISYKFQNASIAIAEPTLNKSNLNNQPLITKLASTYNNPIAIDETPLATASTNLDAATTEEEKASTSYELVDTEDPNRTIMIANFEIDGAAFRGITRRVSALLKRNKSEKEK